MSFNITTTGDYLTEAFGFNTPPDFSKVEYDIAVLHPDRYPDILLKHVDSRFDNTSWYKTHGCAAHSLFVHCKIASMTSLTNRAVSFSGLLFPLAYASDIFVNLFYMITQLGVTIDNYALFVGIKVFNLTHPVIKNIPYLPKEPLPYNLHETAFINSIGWFGYSCSSAFFIPLDIACFPVLGLLHLLGRIKTTALSTYLDFSETLCFTYWIYNEDKNQFEQLLDRKKLDWVKKTFAFEHLSEETWKNLTPNNTPPIKRMRTPGPMQEARELVSFEYSHGDTKPRISSLWYTPKVIRTEHFTTIIPRYTSQCNYEEGLIPHYLLFSS